MKLHREVSKYENELEYKFKVTDNDYRYDKLDKLRGLNESFKFFNSNDKLKGISTQPKFKIGDIVVLKPDAISIHYDNIPYVDDERTRNWMIQNKGSKLLIKGFACEEALNLWLLDVGIENSLTSYFINQDAFTSYGPNYRPRKIDRTLESNTHNYRYFCVKVEDREELNYLLDMLKKISPELVNYRLFLDMEFPNWVFLDTEKFDDEKYHSAVKWDKVTDEEGVNKYLDRTVNVMKKIFTIRDLHAVRRLVLHSGNEPSYEPRKITRTLESKSVFPYRVKTDLELRKEFGNNWRTTVCRDIGWNFGMDHLLGMEYPVADFKKEDHKDDEWIDMDINPNMSWIIMPKLLTRNIPTYTPRKINRTLESVDNPKYKAIVYKLNSQKEFTEIQYKLFREGIRWCTDSIRIETETKYPIYVFVVNKDRSSDKQFFYDCVEELEEGSIEGVLGGRSGIKPEDICPYVFDINTKQTAERLFDYEGVPNYAPRKIVRTLEGIDNNDLFKRNLEDGKYGAICFRMNYIDKKKAREYFEEVGFIKNLDRLYSSSEVLVFFVVNNSDFNTFQLLTAGSGEQITDGTLARSYSFELSPIFTVDQVISYMDSHKNMAKNMYKPRKINRTLESVNQSDIKYMVVCDNRVDSLKFEDMLIKAGYRWGTTRENDYILQTYPSIESVGFCEFDIKNKSFTGFEYDKLKDDSTWLRLYGEYPVIHFPKDVQTILGLEKKMRNMPTYEPRRISRTLEANNFEQTLIKKIQSVLTKDLLIPEWAKKLEQGKHHPFAGHCYAASEALYHLLGGKEKGYKPMRGKGLNNETHWWIVDKEGNKLDPTAEQFYFVGLKPPYEAGKGSGFLTKNPSKRAKEIISRIQNI